MKHRPSGEEFLELSPRERSESLLARTVTSWDEVPPDFAEKLLAVGDEITPIN